MARETGKQRRSRIELDYYRRSDVFSRWRGGLTLAAMLVAAGFVAVGSFWSRDHGASGRILEPSRLASKGPLAGPHAMWDSTCAACHVGFTPINGSRWSPSLWTGSPAGDVQCKTCHAGPPHHASQLARDVSACAECHREHRGRDSSLLAMDDAACTACHRDLSRHRQPGAGPLAVADVVTRFDLEHHPDFIASRAARGVDRGRIKFSHARHLARGLPLVEGGKPFTFDALVPADRARYGWKPNQPTQTPVHLVDCMPCHQLDGDEYARGLARKVAGQVPAHTAGAYMLPVTYENDCRACHPLRFDPNLPDRQIRHGLSPRDVVDELRRIYAAEAVKEDPALLRRFVAPAPVPGRAAPKDERVEQAIADKVLTGSRLLFGSGVDEAVRRREHLPLGRGGCVECHNLKPFAGPLVRVEAVASLEIEPVVMNSLSFEHARFDHTAHRALECAACHVGASNSKENPDPGLLPKIARCVECHSPARSSEGRARGGAGVACTECHRYHNGDHPAQGIGARARQGAARMSIEQFLNGVSPVRDR
ncbi:MAG: hypothetical protein ACHRXM_21720 [Isosphaerales bacterium]